MGKKVSYYAVVFVTIPFAVVGVVTGICESLLGGGGSLTRWVASPFLRAVERDNRRTP